MNRTLWRLRPGRFEDLAALWSIESRAHAFPWSKPLLADSLDKPEASLVAEDGEAQALGYAVFSVVADEAELFNIAVEPKRRRQGIGHFLLRGMLNAAWQQGARQCYLEVRPSNTAALALYRRAGFQTVGRRQDYYPARQGREDALVLHYRWPEEN